MTLFIQQIFNALQWGSFYALIALGYTMVYGVLQLINFAHGDVFMVGAYLAFFVATALAASFGLSMDGLSALVIVVPATMILTSLVGVALERMAYRPLRRKGAGRIHMVITALMCGIILEYGNIGLLGASRRTMPELVEPKVHFVAGAAVTDLKIGVIITCLAVFFLLWGLISRTRLGMAMRAAAWDSFALPLMGVSLDRVIVCAFALGSAIAGLGGLMFGLAYPVLDPFMGAQIGWKAFIAAVIGGIGDIRGALVGAFILAFIEIAAAAVLPSSFRDLLAFGILLFLIWLRPNGIFGLPRTVKI